MASGMRKFFVGKKNQGLQALLLKMRLRYLPGFLLGCMLTAGPALAQKVTSTQTSERPGAVDSPAPKRLHSASKTVLVLGDSLSAEYGLTRGAGWVPLLEQRLRTRHLAAPIINASVSGETTSGGRARLQALLDQHHPGIVVIELGGNDALRGLALNATEANLRAMVEAAETSGAQALLLGMQIPPNYGPAYARQFAGIYPKLARQTGSVLVPFFLEGLQTRTDLFQADRIHPVAAAQPLLLDNVWPYLVPMIDKKQAAASKPGAKNVISKEAVPVEAGNR